MENALIRSPQGSAATPSAARHAGARQAGGAEPAAKGDFSLLLADMAEMAHGAEVVESAAAPGEGAATLAAGDPSVLRGAPAEWPLVSDLFSLTSLVGQTARMDGAADAALRDGRGDGARHQAALPMGAGLPAVGPGLQAISPATGSAWGHAGAADAAADLSPLDGMTATHMPGAETSTLSMTPSERGAQPPQGLAALLAQMEAEPIPLAGAMAAAAAPQANSAAAATGTGPVALSAPTETAVALEPAAPGDLAPADLPVLSPADEAMAEQLGAQVAFWVQQKTQRAAMTIDRQGQPVEVQVTITGSEAHVTFRSSEQPTRDLLDASTAQLRELLEQQGLRLAGVSVQTADAGRQGTPPRQEPAGGPGARAPDRTAMVSTDLRARPDALRAVDVFV